jgi:hypothetical protein
MTLAATSTDPKAQARRSGWPAVGATWTKPREKPLSARLSGHETPEVESPAVASCYRELVAKVSQATRWDLVTVALHDELRAMTDEDKLGQVASLMASVEAMGWTHALQEGDAEIWRRWQTIRANAALRRSAARGK